MVRKSTLGVSDDPIEDMAEEIATLQERIAHLKAYYPLEDTGMLEMRLETLESLYINKIRKGE